VDHTQNQWVDVNGNGMLDPLDVLGIIDYLNQSTFGLSDSLGGEGESRIESLIDSDVNRVTTQGTDLESLSEKEIADRLSVFIEFGKDDEDENFWG
jgi:hypothetical protein